MDRYTFTLARPSLLGTPKTAFLCLEMASLIGALGPWAPKGPGAVGLGPLGSRALRPGLLGLEPFVPGPLRPGLLGPGLLGPEGPWARGRGVWALGAWALGVWALVVCALGTWDLGVSALGACALALGHGNLEAGALGAWALAVGASGAWGLSPCPPPPLLLQHDLVSMGNAAPTGVHVSAVPARTKSK